LFSEFQHGFVKSKSTATNLVSFYQFLNSSLEQRCQVDVFYSDFSKAFDKVNINILLCKLQSLGISDPLLSWFHGYLTSRRQIVRVNGHLSDEFDAASGCPQGGHLSGFLFNLYINDLADQDEDSADIRKWFFADDYRVALKVSEVQDCSDLQRCIDRLVSWCELNRMHLNIDKCHVATFHRIKNPIVYNYKICYQNLSRLRQVKDLGVVFDQDLKFTTHINNITNKGYRNLGFIMRNSKNFTSPKTFKTLYCSLVRSSLEYCSTLWSPSYSTYITQIEKIQNKFLRSLGFKDHEVEDNHDYKMILSKYDMNTLQHRRDVFDIIFILKLLNAQIQCPNLLEQLTFRCNTRNTRNSNIFFIKTSRTNISKSSPLNRCMELCNIISNPPHDIDIFSNSLQYVKEYLLKQFSLHHH
ncbi:hypothetical protein WDU94_005642, partial [Cyamophila willieti]